MSPSLFQVLRTWTDAGWLRELDTAFAEFIAPTAAEQDPLVHLAAALLSHQVGRGQFHHGLCFLGRLLGIQRCFLRLPARHQAPGACRQHSQNQDRDQPLQPGFHKAAGPAGGEGGGRTLRPASRVSA